MVIRAATVLLLLVPVGTEAIDAYLAPFHVGLDSWAPDCIGYPEVVYFPGGVVAMSSQYHDDVATETASDFTGGECDLLGVGWWGVYWPELPPIRPTTAEVILYADDAGAPGDVVTRFVSSSINEELDSPPYYCVTFPEPVPLIEGARYWLSVALEMPFDHQWGWGSGYENPGSAMFRSAALGFDEWTSVEVVSGHAVAMAFSLVTEDDCVWDTPVQQRSWSRLKSSYTHR